MKWAFIDYENTGGLDKVILSNYNKVFIFQGSKQAKIDFGNTKYDSPIDFVLIQIKESQTNNLDFHLSYYLGKYDIDASKNISFYVISNDKGFTPLITHINTNGRVCKQIKTPPVSHQIVDNSKNKLITSLTSRPTDKRPKKIVNLKNHIASYMGVQGNEVAIQNFMNQLLNKKIIIVSGEKVKYNC